MDELIRSVFAKVTAFMPTELVLMPLSRWNESVFRYFFCRFLAEEDPRVTQFVECGKIDLVLRRDSELAFIEFKFYLHPRRYDPYSGEHIGYKGGPGAKNLGELRKCVDDLNAREFRPRLS